MKSRFGIGVLHNTFPKDTSSIKGNVRLRCTYQAKQIVDSEDEVGIYDSSVILFKKVREVFGTIVTLFEEKGAQGNNSEIKRSYGINYL